MELKQMNKTARPRKSPPSQAAPAKISAPAAVRLERQGVLNAIRACESKKAADVVLLELEKGTSAFTDFFVICSGTNPRQIQAISDEVQDQLAKTGMIPTHSEGYNQADWVLLDYVDFVVHIFSENARRFYDLERLWKSAKHLDLKEIEKALAAKRPQKSAAKKTKARTTSHKSKKK